MTQERPKEMNNQLSDFDREIIRDMEQTIATIQLAIDAGPNVGDLIRPKVGDARAQTAQHWHGEIAKLRGWIAGIEKGAA
jgi:hypothetical protein